jgi:hypothetical protein
MVHTFVYEVLGLIERLSPNARRKTFDAYTGHKKSSPIQKKYSGLKGD